MKKKRPVLQDVADRVGVTKMTVSRFLRNPEQVSVALRGKIAAALDELGYIPNRAPDILSNATSRAIGVLLPSLTNQVFAEVLRGIESVTDAHGYQTMLVSGDMPFRLATHSSIDHREECCSLPVKFEAHLAIVDCHAVGASGQERKHKQS